MQRKNAIWSALLFVVLVAVSGMAAAGDLDGKIQAVRKNHPTGELTFLPVPDAGNFIANMIMVATLRGGSGSTSSQGIVEAMTKGVPLAVAGENDGVAAATLSRALQDAKGTLSGKSVIFAGAEEYRAPLAQAAKDAGVNLEFVAVP